MEIISKKTGKNYFCRIISFINDKMDAQKCNIPHLPIQTKHWDNQKGIQSQFVGSIQHGFGTRMYMFDSPLLADGNLNNTVFYHNIVAEYKRRMDAGIPWAKKLYLQLDSASDNKNKSMYMLCEIFVKLGIFEKVKINFLPVGHTHEDIDACFGAGSHILHRNSAFSLQEVFSSWKRGWPGTKSFDYIAVNCIYYY